MLSIRKINRKHLVKSKQITRFTPQNQYQQNSKRQRVMTKKEMIQSIIEKSTIKESSVNKVKSRLNEKKKEFLTFWYNHVLNGNMDADYFVFACTGVRPTIVNERFKEFENNKKSYEKD